MIRFLVGVMRLLVTIWLSEAASAQITVRQTLEIAQLHNLRISPDGSCIAFVATQAQLADNNYISKLLVVPVRGGGSRLVRSAERIASVEWTPDGAALSYVLKEGGVWQAWLSRLNGPATQLTHNSNGVAAGINDERMEGVNHMFRLAPDGRRALYFSRNREEAQREIQRLFNSAILHRPEMSVFPYLDDDSGWQYMPSAAGELWLVDVDTGSERRIWRSPAPGKDLGGEPVWFEWSPDGRNIALLWEDQRDPRFSLKALEVISSETFVSRTLDPRLGGGRLLEWEKDGSGLTLNSTGEPTDTNRPFNSLRARYRLSLADGNLIRIGNAIEEGAIDLASAVKAGTGDTVHHAVSNSAGTVVVGVREGGVVPPEIAAYRRVDGKVIATSRRILTRLNAALDDVKLGEVREIRANSADGSDSAVILPVAHSYRKRYPLLVVEYNLYRRSRFSATARLTYPAQVFAGHGYVVLLHNTPVNTFSHPYGDFETARINEVDGYVTSLRALIDQLVSEGMVDRDRMGIAGWSWGGFIVPYILTHYPDWFRVGAMGEGANHQPEAYWQSGGVWRRQEDSFFGEGGPYGPHATRWRAIAPIANAHKLRAPLLMEYSSAFLSGIELFSSIIERGGKAELYVYRTDRHVLERPLNRMLSMERHFDWFNFWLLDEVDRAPAKEEQYKRWRQLRQSGAAH